MSCRDYVDLDELKAVWPGASALSDASLAYMAFASEDWLDKAVFGHPFNRAVRVYHDKTHGAAGCTVAVTATEVTIIIVGGTDAGTHSFTFAAYPTVQELADAISDHDIGVRAIALGSFTGWVPEAQDGPVVDAEDVGGRPQAQVPGRLARHPPRE